jgi:hypothetical protein
MTSRVDRRGISIMNRRSGSTLLIVNTVSKSATRDTGWYPAILSSRPKVPYVWAHLGEGIGKLIITLQPAGKMEAFFGEWTKVKGCSAARRASETVSFARDGGNRTTLVDQMTNR